MSATVPSGLDPETLEFTLESIDEFAQRELRGAVEADAPAPVRAVMGG